MICPVVGTTVKIIVIESSIHVYVNDLHLVTNKKQETVFFFPNKKNSKKPLVANRLG